jgi:hypothetical protein
MEATGAELAKYVEDVFRKEAAVAMAKSGIVNVCDDAVMDTCLRRTVRETIELVEYLRRYPSNIANRRIDTRRKDYLHPTTLQVVQDRVGIRVKGQEDDGGYIYLVFGNWLPNE